MQPLNTELIRQALAGDQVAFGELVSKYARLLFSEVYAIVRHAGEAEDLVQEACIRAYLFRVRLKSPEKFPQWLLTIARNLARDRLRRRHLAQVTDVLDELPARPQDQPDHCLEAGELRAALHAALAGLPDRHRRAISLRYFDGLDYRAIQARMQISDGALRGILGRGLEKLRQLMNTDE